MNKCDTKAKCVPCFSSCFNILNNNGIDRVNQEKKVFHPQLKKMQFLATTLFLPDFYFFASLCNSKRTFLTILTRLIVISRLRRYPGFRPKGHSHCVKLMQKVENKLANRAPLLSLAFIESRGKKFSFSNPNWHLKLNVISFSYI